MTQKHSYDYIKKTIENMGFVLLSKHYVNAITKMNVVCLCGNSDWMVSFNNLTRGRLCNNCGVKSRVSKTSYSIDDVRAKVEKLGGTLLSSKYKNNKEKLIIKCKNGHLWDTSTFSNILKGCWCPKCKNTKKYTVDEAKKIISDKGGILLSEKYTNVKSHLKIKCLSCNNIWNTSLGTILRGSWCPGCSCGKYEKEFGEIVSSVFKAPVYKIYKRFSGLDWLVNKKTGRALHVDFFVVNSNNNFCIAIEYDGEQHFRPVRFNGVSKIKADKIFKQTVERDKIKNDLFEKHKDVVGCFVRFSYNEEKS